MNQPEFDKKTETDFKEMFIACYLAHQAAELSIKYKGDIVRAADGMHMNQADYLAEAAWQKMSYRPEKRMR